MVGRICGSDEYEIAELADNFLHHAHESASDPMRGAIALAHAAALLVRFMKSPGQTRQDNTAAVANMLRATAAALEGGYYEKPPTIKKMSDPTHAS